MHNTSSPWRCISKYTKYTPHPDDALVNIRVGGTEFELGRHVQNIRLKIYIKKCLTFRMYVNKTKCKVEKWVVPTYCGNHTELELWESRKLLANQKQSCDLTSLSVNFIGRICVTSQLGMYNVHSMKCYMILVLNLNTIVHVKNKDIWILNLTKMNWSIPVNSIFMCLKYFIWL